jgi:signal peptide peptidase SppA
MPARSRRSKNDYRILCRTEETLRVIDVINNSPWAILPEKLLEIREIYLTHLRSEPLDLEAIEARIGRPLKNERALYSVEGTTAIIPIDGILGKKMNLFADISGGTSTQLVERDFQAALGNPAVKSILLAIDSPGGTVDGTENLANVVYAARGNGKRIVALGDGLMASAAYWIGSAADEVYASDKSAKIGSIGAVATHEDYSKAEHAAGVKVTEITAGKYKCVASEHAPLSQDGRAAIQAMVDHVYANFVDSVARNRGVSSQKVADDMADGKVFLGTQAVKAGLVDGIATQHALVGMLNDRAVKSGRLVAGAKNDSTNPLHEAIFVKIEHLRADSPAKRSTTTSALASRARELQNEAARQGRPMTNVEACRCACQEAGAPTR